MAHHTVSSMESVFVCCKTVSHKTFESPLISNEHDKDLADIIGVVWASKIIVGLGFSRQQFIYVRNFTCPF